MGIVIATILGEKSKWEFFYVVDIENGNKQREHGTIEFTGEGKAPGGIDYKLKTTFGGSEETGMSVMKNGAGTIEKGSFGGCVVVQEDEVVEVEISWNVQ